jgi:hypothetical protein
MSMKDFGSEVGLYMGSQPAKPWLVGVLDCIGKSFVLIDVFQRGPNWRGS